MSLPPTEVHIKRKRGEEPVDFLRVHEGDGKRRRRATDFVFSRQPTSLPNNDPVSLPTVLNGDHDINQGQRASSHYLHTQSDLQSTQSMEQQNLKLEADLPESFTGPFSQLTIGPASQHQSPRAGNNTKRSFKTAQPRRFHISRSAIPPSALAPISSIESSKRNAKLTVFVERRRRLKPPRNATSSPKPNDGTFTLVSSDSRPRKKPGPNARTPIPRSREPSPHRLSPSPTLANEPRNGHLPSGLKMPWDTTSAQFVAEMQAYALQEIGSNLAESERTKPGIKTTQTTLRKATKFKPKVPAQRYKERHPEEYMEEDAAMEVDYVDDDDDPMDEDGDYIIDTYVRMSAEDLESLETQKNFGYLVLDSQPDIDEFYRDEDKSDEDEEDEEEDENAENHYTADYPDEVLDSEDEANAYKYRNRNTSDLEEFDENDAVFSDDADDEKKYPWMKNTVEKDVGFDDHDWE